MTEQERIKLILFGNVQRYVDKEELGEEDKLFLLLCSSKDYEAFIKKDIFADLEPPKVKVLPQEPLFEDIKKILKENVETLERK